MVVLNTRIDAQTPNLSVIDNRGLPVRQITYWREDDGTPESRITAHHHDATGRLVAQRDPRLFADASAPANLATVYSLSGQVLSTLSVDAGWRVSLCGEMRQPLHGWDGQGSQRRIEYDRQLRPLAVFEHARDGEPLCMERYGYGGSDPTFTTRNQCGQLIRHDDSAGTQLFEQFGLSGSVMQQTWHFLRALRSPDWPEPPTDRDALLETGAGTTSRSVFNTLGETIEQTDAKGHRQFFAQNLAGQLREVRLQLDKQPLPKTLVSAMQYSAQGQTEQETAGNGVITTLQYDSEDGRLTRLQARHGNDNLQDLRYAYDPVGNVLSIEDAALPIRYFANQRIEPINRYGYDSLYQLIEAIGWEAGGANQGPLFSPFDDPAAVAQYTQTYRYDRGGNLLQLTHNGAQKHGHRLLAAAQSNRCLPVLNGVEPDEEDFRNGFDANGNLLALQPGQSLHWDLRNQLHEVRPVARDGAADDNEHYVYGADGMRLRKVRQTQTNARTLIAETRYLPNLQIRTHSGTGETLQVISVQAGRSSVQVLHWESEPPQGIANDQLRYSLNDHLGSCTLELDSAGQVISHERYHPFGTTAWFAGRGEIEASYKTLRYSSKERDATGLYYYGFRYYVAGWQRWVNPDPSGASDGLNFFGFCGNNPVGRTDPDGRMWQGAEEPAMDAALEQFLDNETALRFAYGLAPYSYASPDTDDDEPMDDQQSPDSYQDDASPSESDPGSPMSPGSPDNPPSPTSDQHFVLDLLNAAAPELRYDWNGRSLLIRDNFGGKVYRADQREPYEVLRDGFNPSDEFTAVKKMISGEALIVSETLEGAFFYAANNNHELNFYEIDATDVRGVSLTENLVVNNSAMLAHLDVSPSDSPSEQTGEANRMHEVHLRHSDLIHHGRPIVSLGLLTDEVERVRRATLL
ncbi:YD repeat-containing protein [Pseudomonas chlororaphis]|uniref:YD repeat-containing protein n=1 Tax=Pseudomonas chlororaphis TaxID=587753 RepID=A0A0A6DDW5_9PSED|nr:YD repeat-containing protein [Pseudomonas chlororaphis]